LVFFIYSQWVAIYTERMIKNWVILFIVGVLFTTSCRMVISNPKKETPTPPATETIQEIVIPTEGAESIVFDGNSFPADVNPLRGQKVTDVRLLERRPMAVKISNDPRPMRPQWGLSLADIVYEYYTEWGKTRFVALFYGKDAEQVGPIRSARFFDENVIVMYKAALAYVGADERVLKRFYKAEFADRLISEWPAGCPPICRIDVKMWNHAVTDTRRLSHFISISGMGNNRQDLRGMAFASQPPADGNDALILLFRYSPYTYNQWVYDFIHREYIRLQDVQDDDNGQGEAYEVMNDRLTGEVITAQNVVVLFVPYSYVVKKEDVEVVNVDLTQRGKAELFRDGKKYDVFWQRKNKETLLTLVDAAGNPFPFKPGNTWFEVVGITSVAVHEAAGIYRFGFSIP
jgi:hypothetical protein